VQILHITGSDLKRHIKLNRTAALQKIKKCLALAASSNPHEAAAAMRQAQKLMAQFQISEIDVSLADVSETTVKAKNLKLVDWELFLAQTVAKAFDCRVYGSLSSSYNANARLLRERRYIFAGVGPASEVAAYAFSVLSRQCAKDRKSHMAAQPKNCKKATVTARGDAYAKGWVWGVRDALVVFAGSNDNQDAIDRYLDSKYGDIEVAESTNRAKGKNVKRADWFDGQQAGSNVRLDRGIASTAGHQPLLQE
jgi:hypothetical protein